MGVTATPEGHHPLRSIMSPSQIPPQRKRICITADRRLLEEIDKLPESRTITIERALRAYLKTDAKSEGDTEPIEEGGRQ